MLRTWIHKNDYKLGDWPCDFVMKKHASFYSIVSYNTEMTNTKTFVQMDEEVRLLLQVIPDYEASKFQENVDGESWFFGVVKQNSGLHYCC